MTQTNGHDPVALAKALDHTRGEELNFSGWTRDEARVLLRKVGVYIAAQVQPLQKQIEILKARLEEIEKRGIEYRGVYQRAQIYQIGNMVTHDNNLYSCISNAEVNESPGSHPSRWCMALRVRPRQPTKGGQREHQPEVRRT
jgi:hypothetical protein